MTDAVPGISNCRWITVRGAADERGRLNFIEGANGLPFAPLRLFWLHHIQPGQWRARHGHRRTELLLIALAGGCRVHLDDARAKVSVTLDDPGKALYVGTWVWHELTDFAPDSVILAIASTAYDEAEYLRDYKSFVREARTRS